MCICEDITLEKKKFYWEVFTAEHYTGCRANYPRHGPCPALPELDEPAIWRLELYKRLGFPPLDESMAAAAVDC